MSGSPWQSNWSGRLAHWSRKLRLFVSDVAFRIRHGDDREHLEFDEVGLRVIACDRVLQSIEWSKVSRCYIWQHNNLMYELTMVTLGDDTKLYLQFDELMKGSTEARAKLNELFPGFAKHADDFSNRAFQAYESGRMEHGVALALTRGQPAEVIPWPMNI